jgi:peroxiredoxin Q/BCP
MIATMSFPKAPDFNLQNQDGIQVSLSDCLKTGPVLLVFYPGDFTPVCTKQLCGYRDQFADFEKFGVRILGISHNSVEEHAKFRKENGFSFDLLSDRDKSVYKAYGAGAAIFLGLVGRAVVLVNAKQEIVFKHVEITPLSHRRADEIIENMEKLRATGAL